MALRLPEVTLDPEPSYRSISTDRELPRELSRTESRSRQLLPGTSSARLDLLKRSESLKSCGGLRRHLSETTPKDKEVSWVAILSGVGLCANTVVGAGTLALPFTMSLVGFVLYHVLIVMVLVVSSISLKWLVEVADVLPDDVPRSYEGIAHRFLGPQADAAISAALLFGGFALTMAYMLFITTSAVSVLSGPLAEWLPPESIHSVILFGIGFGLVLPLLMLQDISKLRLTSAFAICALLATSSYVVISGWTYVSHHGVHDGVVAARVSVGLFDAIPMCLSAYSCHILVIPIYDSLGNGRSPALMGKVLVAALFLAAFIYEIVGIAGYLHFGNKTHGNILQDLATENAGSPIITAVNIAMAIALICHVPFVVWPLRSCIISAYHYLVVGFDDVDGGPTALEWRVTSLMIMIGVLAMVTLMPSIKTALSIVGSIGGAFIVFIFPAAFRLAVVKQLPPGVAWLSCRHASELSMMGIGSLLGIFCFSMSVMNSIAGL